MNKKELLKLIENSLSYSSLTDFFESLEDLLLEIKKNCDEEESEKACQLIIDSILDEAAKRNLENDGSHDIVVYKEENAVMVAAITFLRISGVLKRLSFRELYGFQKFMRKKISIRLNNKPLISEDLVIDVFKELNKNYDCLEALANDTLEILLLKDDIGEYSGAFFDESDGLLKWYLALGAISKEEEEVNYTGVDILFMHLGILIAKQVVMKEGIVPLLNELPIPERDKLDEADILSAAASNIAIGLRYGTRYAVEIMLEDEKTKKPYDLAFKLHWVTLRLMDKILKYKAVESC